MSRDAVPGAWVAPVQAAGTLWHPERGREAHACALGPGSHQGDGSGRKDTGTGSTFQKLGCREQVLAPGEEQHPAKQAGGDRAPVPF